MCVCARTRALSGYYRSTKDEVGNFIFNCGKGLCTGGYESLERREEPCGQKEPPVTVGVFRTCLVF